MILDKVSFVMPMPHSTSALYIETLHCLRQIDLPLIVLLLKLVLNLLKHLPHRCLHIFLCHQASAQLLGYNQWERLRHCLYWCRLRLCLGCGRLLGSAWSCLCRGGFALRCAHSSCPFCCISFNHRSLCRSGAPGPSGARAAVQSFRSTGPSAIRTAPQMYNPVAPPFMDCGGIP